MVSKRASYALHGVAYLAYRLPDAPVPFPEILRYLQGFTKELSLSPGYISKVFQDLSRSGLVRAVPGRKGGYALARAPRDVRVIDVVTAVDGAPSAECCLLSVGGCTCETTCGVHEVIQKAQALFTDYLSRENADTLARRMFKKGLQAEAGRRAARSATARKKARRKGRSR
ncbi:MAG: Rrf2 family transcriptional regulator [Planctomycetota bacterium]